MRLYEFITESINVDENLKKWFKDKWVRFGPDGKIRGDCARGSSGEGKPKCLPKSKAQALGKKGRASSAAKKRREDPNPERRGAAKNVSTKVKETQLDEACWKGYHKEGMKTMFGKKYPNCVKNKKTNEEIESAVFETLQQRLGSDEIRRIQQMLNVKYNANLDIDGELGPLTIKSIKEFLPKANQGPAPTPEKTTAVQGKQTKSDKNYSMAESALQYANSGIVTASSCARTQAVECQCESIKKITESMETVTAVCVLAHSDTVKGTILLKQLPNSPTLIVGKITGLTPGLHGFHIHEFGDLSKGCESAGKHYNPDGVDHGDSDTGHVGDLGNITADKNGVADFEITAARVDLMGDRSVVGRAIVVHEKPDDLGQGGDAESLKTGNAGERLACGVITLKQTIAESVDMAEAGRVARKPGQPANSKKHSDLYTDENPKGTITGLKFATPEDARASVSKIRNSGRSHAHKMQAAVAMEQRAKAAGKTEAASVYRRYINANKKTDESMSKGIPFDQCPCCGDKIVHESQLNEKQDACYHKVKSRYKVWPSAYASGALVQCRKKGAANWGNGGKKNESIEENFADGKNPQDKGDSARHGIPKGATMAELEKAAKAPGRKGQLARWQINMRRGKKK